MKRVILLRHASANVKDFNQENDFEKPLDVQGESDSKRLSKWLKKNLDDLDTVITSNALRAIQTSEIVFTSLKILIQKNSSFYLCNHEEIIYTIRKLDNKINCVAIVGHEPSISDTLKALVKYTRPDLEKNLNIPYEPCTMSILYFNIGKWTELKEKSGTLEGYLTPKILDLNG